MTLKLIESARQRWRAVTGASPVAPARAGEKFENGVLAEHPETAVA